MSNRSVSAISDGLLHGGVEFSSNFPGFFSQDIFFSIGGDKISVNERVAFEMAYGASLAGKRSVVTMKNVGLNACADPFLHSIIAGVNAGMVIVVTDDIDVVASQEKQDSRHYFDFFGGLWFEPTSLQSAYDIASKSFILSEKYDIPVIIRLTSNFFKLVGDYYEQEVDKKNNKKTPRLDPEKHVIYPTYWKRQQENLDLKNTQIESFVDDFHNSKDSINSDNLLISVGCHDHIPEEYKEWEFFEISTYPIPKKTIKEIIKNRKKVHIIENGDNYVMKEIKRLFCEDKGLPVLSSNNKPEIMADQNWTVWNHLEILFKALRDSNPSLVVGDVGQYTVESTGIISACLCLGSSVGITLGLALSEIIYPICIVGDTSFLHSGTQAIKEAIARKAAFGIIVLDNGGAVSTGGQEIISSVFEIDERIRKEIIVLKETSEDQLKEVFIRMYLEKKLQILYIKI